MDLQLIHILCPGFFSGWDVSELISLKMNQSSLGCAYSVFSMCEGRISFQHWALSLLPRISYEKNSALLFTKLIAPSWHIPHNPIKFKMEFFINVDSKLACFLWHRDNCILSPKERYILICVTPVSSPTQEDFLYTQHIMSSIYLKHWSLSIFFVTRLFHHKRLMNA